MEHPEDARLSLVHLALTDDNRETRHIHLVTAIEVLLKEQDRPKPILDALRKLRAVIDEWPEDDVKKRMAEILRQNKEESILRAGQDQVAAKQEGTYSDKSAEDSSSTYITSGADSYTARENENPGQPLAI